MTKNKMPRVSFKLLKAAVNDGNVEEVKNLINRNVVIDAYNGEIVWTFSPNNNTVKKMEILKILLDNGLGPSSGKNYLFQIACSSGNLDMLKLLYNYKPIYYSDGIYDNFLRTAARHLHLDVMEFLLIKRPEYKLYIPSAFTRAVAYFDADKKIDDLKKMIQKFNISKSIINKSLSHAMHVDVIELLVNNGASLNGSRFKRIFCEKILQLFTYEYNEDLYIKKNLEKLKIIKYVFSKYPNHKKNKNMLKEILINKTEYIDEIINVTNIKVEDLLIIGKDLDPVKLSYLLLKFDEQESKKELESEK